MPSIILSVSIPLDQEADEPVAVVSFTLADKEVVLGELHDVSRIPVEQMQQLLMNTFGDLVEVREGEVIEYLGPLSDFKNESHWK